MPKKRCPKGTRRDSKTKQCVKTPSASKQNKKVTKTIKYGFDGGITTQKLHFPGVNLNYISPANSEGIFNEDFSGLNFENSDLSYSYFTNCDFRKTNMKRVNIDNSKFQGSDFRGAVGLTAKQKKIIKTTGGFLTERDVTIFKDQQKKLVLLAKEYNKLKKQVNATRDKLFKISESNPAHGDSIYVTNKYKIF